MFSNTVIKLKRRLTDAEKEQINQEVEVANKQLDQIVDERFIYFLNALSKVSDAKMRAIRELLSLD